MVQLLTASAVAQDSKRVRPPQDATAATDSFMTEFAPGAARIIRS